LNYPSKSRKSYIDFVEINHEKALKFRQEEVQINPNLSSRKDVSELTSIEYSTSTSNSLHCSKYDVANKQYRLNKLNEVLHSMRSKPECQNQIETINIYEKYLKNNPFSCNHSKDKQIIGFISGQGGTGKSEIIRILTEMANLTYGRSEGIYGKTINVAPTGSAGILI
jgi:hypothetical protein